MEPNVTIRPMRVEDLDRVMELENVCFRNPWLADMFVSEMEGPCSFARVLEVDGFIEAYATFRVIFDEAHLFNIAVAPDARGKRLSKLLLTRVLEESLREGGEVMFLEVRASNDVARRLYESYHFYPIGRRKKYYEDGEDAVVMECQIREALGMPKGPDPSIMPLA